MSSNYEDYSVGLRLQALRQGRNESQQVFADSLGVSLRTYQNYERGDRPVSKEVLSALLEKHGVDVGWVLSGRPTRSRASAGIDLAVFAEVLNALAEDRPDLRSNGLVVGVLTLVAGPIYNQACVVSDPEERREVIARGLAMLQLDQLRDQLAAAQENPFGLKDSELRKLVGALKGRISEAESQLLDDSGARGGPEAGADVAGSIAQLSTGAPTQRAGRMVRDSARDPSVSADADGHRSGGPSVGKSSTKGRE